VDCSQTACPASAAPRSARACRAAASDGSVSSASSSSRATSAGVHGSGPLAAAVEMADMAGVSYPVVQAYVAERKTGIKLGEVGVLNRWRWLMRGRFRR
jgi:hypothetical protein